MKSRSILFLLSLAIAGTIFSACSKEESNLSSNIATGNLKAGYAYVDCNTQCIEPGSGDYYFKTDQQVVNFGNKTKTVEIMYYNTETEFVLKVKSTNGWSDLVIDGISSWVNGPVAANTWGTYTIPLASGWQACDFKGFNLKVAGNGPQAEFNVSYNLIGLCGCDESFTYTENADGSYTFTYVPEEDMIDANLVFTFAQGVVVTGLEGWSSNGVTKQKIMDLSACTVYSWTVFLEGECNGKSGRANLWTDFKVNEVSKKGELSNIELNCE